MIWWKLRTQDLTTRIVCMLPLKAAYAMARFVGFFLSFMPTSRRSALSANIAVAHGLAAGDSAVRRDVRRAFQHAMLNYVDLFRLARYDAPELVDSIHVEDWQPYLDVAARGKGVILVSAHLGNFDTVVQTLALHGVRTLIPVEPLDPPELLDAIRTRRAMLGTEIIAAGPDTFKRLAVHLRSGGTVVIVCDRDIQGTGCPVSFFGRTVALPQAAVLLSIRTGAPILGAFGYRHRDNSISGRFSSEIPVARHDGTQRPSLRQALDEGMRAIVALLEREIRRDPGQWVVQQPIFGVDATSEPTPASPAARLRPQALSLAGLGSMARKTKWSGGRR